MNKNTQPAYEVLTVEQFADRLQVSRATVFNWMQRNILLQGLHYFRIGRILRFVWNAEAALNLLQCTGEAPASVTSGKGKLVPSSRKSTAINFEYS